MAERRQIYKSIGGTALGVTPGLVWYAVSGTAQGLVLAGLGAFIGFALSLPGVSASRVANLTAGVIVANNVPTPMKHKVMDHFVKDDERRPTAPAARPQEEGRTLERPPSPSA